MTKRYSEATTVILDSDGNQRLIPVSSDVLKQILERRKGSIDDAVKYMLLIAELIELSAPMTLREELSAAFRKYAKDIQNGVDEKSAAKNFTNGLGITTNNKRPSQVTNNDIINYILSKASEPVGEGDLNICTEVNTSLKQVGIALGVSKTRVFDVWKSYKSEMNSIAASWQVLSDADDEQLMEYELECFDENDK